MQEPVQYPDERILHHVCHYPAMAKLYEGVDDNSELIRE